MAIQPRYRLLIVDSDLEYLAKLNAVLEQDFEVCALDHPHAALEKLDLYMPDMIILEVELPDMDGIKFAHKVRRCPMHKHVPLIFLTHRDGPADRHLGFMVQAAMYLSKQMRPQRIALDLAIYIREHKPRIRPKAVEYQAILAELPVLPKLAEPEPPPPPVVEQAPPPPPAVEKKLQGSQTVGMDAYKAMAAQKRTSAPALIAEPIRILVADGEYSTIFSISSLLSEQYNCIAATSGPEALDKAQRFMPDMLILNMALPQTPGYEVCQALRGLPPFEKTPILGVTRTAQPPRLECERIYGVTQVFNIPAEFDRLARRVREIIKSPEFRRRMYPQSFDEVWAEEEHYRMLRG